MGSILIKNGRVIDPLNKIDAVSDVLVKGDKIARVAPTIKDKAEGVIDASGKIVMPGVVDMHVHLREPGREDKETIETATKAAAKGGVTSLLAMPNTTPPADSAENIMLIRSIIEKNALVNVFVAGTITIARKGLAVSDIAGIKKAGVIAITDDGSSVDDEAIMAQALKEAKKHGVLLIGHCEDRALSAGGVVNLGIISTRMGLKGISSESEYKRVSRDIALAKKIDVPIHITHISCKESVEIIAKAKKSGLKVSTDVTSHHIALSQEAVLGYDTNMKMNPPLRGKDDILAIKEGLKSGIIDAIASDHAPHTINEKDIEFDRAEFGVIGLETELSAGITELVLSGILSWPELVNKVSVNPARILGLQKGSLGVGCDADIAIVDPDAQWQPDASGFVSKSKNSAFIGKRLSGLVVKTICMGKIVY